MECYGSILLLFGYVLLFLSHRAQPQLLPVVDDGASRTQTQTYIVHVEKPEGSPLLRGDDHRALESWHRTFLPVSALDSGEPRLVYSYRHAISGFAARLTPMERKAMESMDGFVHAEPDRTRRLATTYTPEFLGVDERANGAWSSSNYGEGVVIGVIDTGITPNHPSFNDDGMPPPPPKWKGSCVGFKSFACNNKIIGGAAFWKGKKGVPVIDEEGHGTHVASTAAGSFVAGAQVLGMANGTAAGLAPKAHLAIYKVCYPDNCRDADILAAIDQAIKDGVDIITMSLGGPDDEKFYLDSVARGSLSAIKHGIVAIAAAGNSGPAAGTLSHSAPWVLTVGASSTDRRITSLVKLGDGVGIAGESAYQPSTSDSSMLPIVYPGAYHLNANVTYCMNGTLDGIDVRGKIVVCSAGVISSANKGEVVVAAGGAGLILMNTKKQGYTTSAHALVLPSSNVNFRDGALILAYLNSSIAATTHTAVIAFKGTQFGYKPSPTLTYFSSRGPSAANGGILKPDVLAPGLNILAAWPFEVEPHPTGHSRSTFNFVSGTSMAAPHVAGIVALLKSKHPKWSPSAIQSAIITSANGRDIDQNVIVDESTGKEADIFHTGAGQVRPSGALDPGLVYDVNPADYTGYLCGLGYTDEEVQTTVGEGGVVCSSINTIEASQLNYPSITAYLGPNSRTITITRTVTNVGPANSFYKARISAPKGVEMIVSNPELTFNSLNTKRTFTVKLVVNKTGITKVTTFRGELEWVSDSHVVASPIAVLYTP